LGSGETEGQILISLCDMMGHFLSNADFDFAANVVTNSTCSDPGRLFFLKNLDKLTKLAQSPSAHKRLRISEALKNLAFQYEEHLDTLLEGKILEAAGKSLLEIN
jgi:hypothetical protein